MGIVINGEEKEVDDYGYLLEPDYSEEAVTAFAAAIGGAVVAGAVVAHVEEKSS